MDAIDARPRAAVSLFDAALFIDLAVLRLAPALGGFAYHHCGLWRSPVDSGEPSVSPFEKGGEGLDVHSRRSPFIGPARSPATEGDFAASISATATRTHRASCFNFDTLVSSDKSRREAA